MARLGLAVLLLTYLGLGAYYTWHNPLFAKPDEAFHYAYVRHLMAGNGLPVIDTTHSGLGGREAFELEAHQPPFYYALVAGSGLALPDTHVSVERNPHFLATEVGNQNPYVPAFVRSPLEAPVVIAGRVVSLLGGLLLLVSAYKLTSLFRSPSTALLTTTFVAFNPQFIFMSTSFSNDIVAAAMTHAGLWQIAQAWRRGFTYRRGLIIGVVVALATLTKLGGLGLLGPLALLALWSSCRQRRWRPILVAAVAGALCTLLCSWWFWRNWLSYHDPFTISLLPGLLGQRATPRGVEEWQSVFGLLFKSSWLDFSPGLIFFAPDEVYTLLLLACVLSVAGGIWLLATEPTSRPFLLLAWGWFAMVFAAWVRMNAELDLIMGGGRLLLPAVVALGGTLAIGLHAVLRRVMLVWLLALALCSLAVLAPESYLSPHYPQRASAVEPTHLPEFLTDAYLGESSVQLIGYELAVEPQPQPPSQPQLLVTYYWRPLRTLDRNFSVFLQLLGPDLVKFAQLDTYPGYGTFPTGQWPSGDVVVDQLSLPLPVGHESVSADLITGLYYFPTQERLAATDREGRELPSGQVVLAQVRSTSRGGLQVWVEGRLIAEVYR